MQRKGNISSQALVADMHFAVVPYEVEFLVPNNGIYQIYFQKGLQILGTTQRPIYNDKNAKRVQLPIVDNIITFRLFSEKNSQYQWSIYKRVDEMEEFLETKKINLKDILKKQPQKRIENQKKNPFERKQSMNPRRNDIKASDLKGTTKTSELKNLESKNFDLKILDQNLTQRLSEISNEGNFCVLIEGKGCIYDEQVKSDLGQFVMRFYLFKAYSHQDLSKAIEQKSRQKKEERIPLGEINMNKASELPRINEIQAPIQEAQMDKKVPEQQEKKREENIETYPVIDQEPKIEQKKIIPEEINEITKTEQKMTYPIVVQQQKIEEETSFKQRNQDYIQLVQEIQPAQVREDSNQQVVGQLLLNAKNLIQEGQNAGQTNQIDEQQLKVETPVQEVKIPIKFSLGKKMFIVGLILMIVLYALYSLNVFEKLLPPVKQEVPKKEKKEKFSNRKKSTK